MNSAFLKKIIYIAAFVWWFCVYADEPACPKSVRSRTVSLNLAFNQGRVNRGFTDLDNVGRNGDAQKELSAQWSARSFNMNEDVPFQTMMQKKDLLATLAKNIRGSEYVNFNFSGHGLLTSDGEWAIPLPALPPSLFSKCRADFSLENDKVNKRRDKKWSPGCEDLEKYVVRSSDLRKLFAGKKVFGLNDSCFSGGLDLGPNSSMLNSAGNFQLSDDSASLTRLSHVLAKRNCVPLGAQNPANFGELEKYFTASRSGARLSIDKIEQLVCASPAGAQCKSQFIVTTDQLPTVTGTEQPWTKCFPMAKAVPPSCQGGTETGSQAPPESLR